MNTIKYHANRSFIFSRLVQFVAMVLLLSAASLTAGQLIWSPTNPLSGSFAGNGNWDTNTANTVWYTGSSYTAWTQSTTTTPLNNAVFGSLDGNWFVTNDLTEIAVSNLTVSNSGYNFYGPNATYIGANSFLTVAAGKTVTFNCPMAGSGTAPCWVLGSGSTMNVTGNLTSGQQLRMAGAADSAFYLSGVNTPAIVFVLGPVYVTNGSITPSSSFYIGYAQTLPAPNSTAYSTGSLTVSGSSTVCTFNGNIYIIARSGGNGTLNIPSGTVNIGNTTASRNLAIDYDSSANSSAIVNVTGGTLNVGSAGQLGNAIDFFDTAAAGAGSGAVATLTESSGVINAWGGIVFGSPSGSFAGGSAALNLSGGTLYVGSKGIVLNTEFPPSINLALSGGTVGALANWSSSLPMTLAASGTNVIFNCGDAGGDTWNIALSGALTGAGGVCVAGSGALTLSGPNNYAGPTVVSNGALDIVTGSTPMAGGGVTVDDTLGAAALTLTVSDPGQYWTNNGPLTFQNGSSILNFQFGAFTPSATVAPMQVAGGVNFAATPILNVSGAAMPVGTYPLIKYTASVSGAAPSTANVTLSSGTAAGYVTNMAASKTIALVITSSTYNPALFWGVGNGAWDDVTPNWKQFGSLVTYSDGDAVVFDNSAGGTSPITVTLNTSVAPLEVTFDNMAPLNYILAGSGSIASSAGPLSLLGSGSVTLAGANTYSAGTVLSAGQLNINNGGTAGASAIGTGPLTINAGTAMDNTSGANVTLQPTIEENWNGNFNYVGSAGGLNTGNGSVTLNGNISIGVASNNFTVGGSISDNGNQYSLTKTGAGALTLSMPNPFTGGMTLLSGLLNLGDPNAAGQSVLTIDGGEIDNVSGAPMSLAANSQIWQGSFSFLGSANLDMGPGVTVTVPPGQPSITVNVANNTLQNDYNIVSGNTTVIKTGNGIWNIAGTSTSANNFQLVIDAGQVNMARLAGQTIGGGNIGLTINAGALAIDTAANYQVHSDSPGTPVPVVLSGGTWDLNGRSENVDKLTIENGGTLRNGDTNGDSTMDLISGFPAILSGANCQFDVAPGAILTMEGPLGGSGSLVTIDSGTLALSSNNTYTGSTIISNGTLALMGAGSISNTANIDLAGSNSVLDLTQSSMQDTNGNPILALQDGQTLSGFGAVIGVLHAAGGSTIAPGNATTLGALSLNGFGGDSTLAGVTMMKLNAGIAGNDLLHCSGHLVLGGILSATNLSGSFAIGQGFTLFQADSLGGSFSGYALPALPANMAWSTSELAVNGSLFVVTNASPPKSLTILQQPSSALNQPLGQGVELCVSADSPATNNLQYQWRRNGVIILPADTNFQGAATSCLSIPEFQATDSGAFSVEVGDGVTNVLSNPANVTPDVNTVPGGATVETAATLPQTGSLAVLSSNTNVVKEKGAPNIIANDPGGSEIWFQWTAPSTTCGGNVTFTTLGSDFDTILGAYSGTAISNLAPVPTVINDDDGAGYLNSQITFYANAGATYLIAVDGFFGAQGDVVLSLDFSPCSDALPNSAATPPVVIAASNATVVLPDPWPGTSVSWYLNDQLVAANQTALTIKDLSGTNVGAYFAGYTTPDSLFTVYSEPIQVEINTLEDGATSTNAVVWPKFLQAANDIFVQPAAGQVIKLGGTAGYSCQQTFSTSVRNNPNQPGEPVPPGGQNGGYPVWFTYTMPAPGGVLEINTDSSGYPTILEAFYGNVPPAYTSFANLSPAPGGSAYYQSGIQPSIYLTNVPANQIVSVMVEGVNGAVGSCNLNLYSTYPSASVNMRISETKSLITIIWSSSGGPYLQYTSTPGNAGSWVSWVDAAPSARPPGSMLFQGTPTNTFTTPLSGAGLFFRLGSN